MVEIQIIDIGKLVITFQNICENVVLKLSCREGTICDLVCMWGRGRARERLSA